MSSGVYAHFIGIGGAGMSGIASVLNERGIGVTGSDLKESRYTTALREQGIDVSIGHSADNLGTPEVVVVSSAIPETNPELAEARRAGLEVWPRARMLAHLAEDRVTVAIAGTHGKTTTSSMIAAMLFAMGEAPTFLIGGEVASFDTNARCGEGRHYVVEADESDGSFMFLDPLVAVVTNVEADHLDHYGTLEEVERTFVAFMSKVPADGTVVACADDARLMELVSGIHARVLTYGWSEMADLRFHSLESRGLGHRFAVAMPDGSSVSAEVALPGKHMVSNATAAIAVAYALGLDALSAGKGLSGFSGVRRRFDQVGVVDGITFVDDYAHHPTEVRATLRAAKESGFGRIWAIFQPHRYSRTAALGWDFGAAFEDADRIVLMDVYSAGETPVPGVSGKTLVETILAQSPRARVAYLPHRADIEPYVRAYARPGDLIMTMGAGDVTTVGPELVRAMEPGEKGQKCR
ncbi:MAG: UDP-N-acetylmuramate--L-alanine ligase [Actinomycetota bacterium]|nr:UDP-N-acetylmuramate--L-alanine ligase [Actinomycetota bacterium]